MQITGIGTETDPYRVVAATSETALQFADTATVDLTKSGAGTAVSPYKVTADMKLDPSGGIVAGQGGVGIALEPDPLNILRLTTSGRLLAENTVSIATDANNAVERRSTGLFVASSNAGFTPAQLANAKLSDIGDTPASFTAGQMLYRGASAWTAITLGNGLAVASGVAAVTAKAGASVTVDSGGVGVAVRTSGGVKHSSTGLEVDTTVVAAQSDLNTLRAELFGGTTRTRAPALEIRGPTYTQNAGTGDIFAQGGWSAFNGDLDSMLRSAGSTSVGDSPYDRIVIPIAGRYEVDFWAESDAVTGTQACKVTLNSRTVNTSSICSDLNRAGGEGTPLHASANLILAAGNVLYWSTFTDTNTTWRSQWYGIYTKIVVRWIGPR